MKAFLFFYKVKAYDLRQKIKKTISNQKIQITFILFEIQNFRIPSHPHERGELVMLFPFAQMDSRFRGNDGLAGMTNL